MLIKQCGDPIGTKGPERKYSAAERTATIREPIFGMPELEAVSTSHVERQNLGMRMGVRRFTRLTKALSKKTGNHAFAVALHFMHYNFCRTHKSLRMTPAMAAGHVWSPREAAGMAAPVERAESAPKEFGPYKPRRKAISN